MRVFPPVLRASAAVALVLVSGLAASAQGTPEQRSAQGTPEQRSACVGDAFRLCGAEIPDVSRITFCMKVNFSKLSPGCKAVFVQEPMASR